MASDLTNTCQRTTSGLSKTSQASRPPVRDEIIEVAAQDPNKVLLHPTEAGDPYYIGDIYDDQPLEIAKEWELKTSPTNTPYLLHVKALSQAWPHLRFLADFMEVGTTPLRWCFLKDQDSVRKERLERTRVARLDFYSTGKVVRTDFNKAADLKESLRKEVNEGIRNEAAEKEDAAKKGNREPIDKKDAQEKAHDNDPDDQSPNLDSQSSDGNAVQYCLFIVEDLSCSVIEALGGRFDIDPSFFREHIVDYAWYNVRDRFMDPPNLDIITQTTDWFQVRWVRSRYFRTRESFQNARVESNRFNVLRRPDEDMNNKALLDDEDAVVGLTRTRASFWRSQPGAEEIPVGILLLDPTISEGTPLWKGYRNFESPPHLRDPSPLPAGPPRSSLFEDVIYWTMKPYSWCPNPVPLSAMGPIIPIQGFLHLVCAEWLTMISYLSTRLGQLEWEISYPEDFLLETAADSSLKKLHVWRRLIPLYIEMLKETLDRVFRFPPQPSANLNSSISSQSTMCSPSSLPSLPSFYALKPSFQKTLAKMEEAQQRLHQLTHIATAAINIAESRLSYKENKNISRLSWLATIYIPFSALAGLFSIQPDIPGLVKSFKYFFAVSIPLAVFTIFVAAIAKKSIWMDLQTFFHLSKGRADKKKNEFVFYGKEAYKRQKGRRP